MRAGAYAAGLARRQSCDLVVVFVHTPGVLAAMRPESLAGMAQTNAEQAEQLRLEIDQNAGRLGIVARFLEGSGDPVTEIAKIADGLRVDAVIVGASTRVGHRFVGALGGHLIRLARSPGTL